MNKHRADAEQDDQHDQEPVRVVRAEELFGEDREIWIELDGAVTASASLEGAS